MISSDLDLDSDSHKDQINNNNNNNTNNNKNNTNNNNNNNAGTYESQSQGQGQKRSNSTTLTLPRLGKSMLKSTKLNSTSNIAQSDNSVEVYGGVFTWSLLTMTNENYNDGGYLLSLPRGTGDRGSSKREIWCVLIDRMFFNYASYDSLKSRLHADLRNCYITPMEGGVFSIDDNRSSTYSFKTLYFQGKNRKEGAKWFWKLYTQSASNNVQKYSNLNFRNGK